MQLSEIFEQLTYGDLKQLSVGGYDDGGIQVEHFPEVISHINLGLTALYARFPLSEKEVTIKQFVGMTDYVLDTKYSVSKNDPTVVNKYIIDTVLDPFLDDILRIEGAFDEEGTEIPLNAPDNEKSIFTPTFDSVQIPFPVATNSTFLVYRANHAPIPLNTTVPATVRVDLPRVLVEALLAYVASRVHGGRTGETAAGESMTSLAKYKRICANVEDKNLLRNAASNTNVRLDTNGWA